MAAADEAAVAFSCGGDTLVGIVHRPERSSKIGVVIVVGGPQYRAGSHRLFVQIARTLARNGVAALRFDARGMGDSTGEFPGFEALDADIKAAIDEFLRTLPGLQGVVLWGLCDAASAIAMYASHDQRVAGIALVNPWVRTEVGLARTQLRHYYLQRFLSGEFWRKIRRGDWRPGASLRSLGDTLRGIFGAAKRPPIRSENVVDRPNADYVTRMAKGLADYQGRVMLILSGNDFVAREFGDLCGRSPTWRGIVGRPDVTRFDLQPADHTFSSGEWTRQVADWTLRWLSR